MRVFFIAEIGINHNGDLEIAKQLIDSAVDCGCDAVKFQKRTIEDVYSPEELDVYRESPFGTTNREQKHGLECLRFHSLLDQCKICLGLSDSGCNFHHKSHSIHPLIF